MARSSLIFLYSILLVGVAMALSVAAVSPEASLPATAEAEAPAAQSAEALCAASLDGAAAAGSLGDLRWASTIPVNGNCDGGINCPDQCECDWLACETTCLESCTTPLCEWECVADCRPLYKQCIRTCW